MSIFVGIEKLSLVDFDSKISCTLFTSGCNFRCTYCHNTPLMYNNHKMLNWNEIKEFLHSRKNILDAVVITGGEPTINNELPNYLKEIKSFGYLIKLDTNGTNPKMIQELIKQKLIDYIAMDIKTSIDNYQTITKNKFLNLDTIKESINIIKTSNIPYEFRTTLVKEYHNIQIINDIKDLLKGANKLYLQKFILRDTCLDQTLHEVDKQTAEEYQKILKETIKEVKLRGY